MTEDEAKPIVVQARQVNDYRAIAGPLRDDAEALAQRSRRFVVTVQEWLEAALAEKEQ